MSYEPKGKVKMLCDAMASHPEIALPAPECARIMGVPQSALPAYMDAPIRHHALYPLQFSGSRFYGLTSGAKPRAVDLGQPPPPLATTANGWNPPQMTPPRGTSAPVASGRLEQSIPMPPAPIATRPPQPAPVLADASITEAASAEVDEQDEAAEPVTWNLWEDGDLDLFGLVELEGGGYRMPKEALSRLRKFIAWMPA